MQLHSKIILIQFSKTSSIVTDVEFKFDDNKKILTATSKDVHVDHNRLK